MKAELEDIKGGQARDWKNFYDLLWTVGLVRYTTQKQLLEAFKDATWRKKCATPKVMAALVSKGFLARPAKEVFTLTAKGKEFLRVCAEPEYPEYNTALIKLATGQGERDTLYNTAALLEVLKLPDFYALFYDEFYEKPSDKQPWLIPDACLVLRRQDQEKGHQAKLIFLEIENKKPEANWREYLEGKRRKYSVIGQRLETWLEWWKRWCGLLRLKLCPVEEFGFLVWCIGDFRADWEGWKYGS